MGAWANRITAADFLTPPELAGLSLAADGAGRIGGVRVELVTGAGGTTLGQSYQQVPLRLLPPFRLSPGQPALLYLLNPTAGLLDGDGQRVELFARVGSRAVVVGQSATRIHPCLRGFSTQQWRVLVEPGAVLVVLPGPAIPFQGCRYFQSVEIDLGPGAHVLWGDVWLAGRHERGADSERFQFHQLVQELVVRRAGRLVFRDRFCWHGPWDDQTAEWHFGGAAAAGSVFASGPLLVPPIAAEAAVLQTEEGDHCLRCRGEPAAVTACVVQAALGCAARLAGDAQPWLAGEDLAPNHWFSPVRRCGKVR